MKLTKLAILLLGLLMMVGCSSSDHLEELLNEVSEDMNVTTKATQELLDICDCESITINNGHVIEVLVKGSSSALNMELQQSRLAVYLHKNYFSDKKIKVVIDGKEDVFNPEIIKEVNIKSDIITEFLDSCNSGGTLYQLTSIKVDSISVVNLTNYIASNLNNNIDQKTFVGYLGMRKHQMNLYYISYILSGKDGRSFIAGILVSDKPDDKTLYQVNIEEL